MDLLRGRIDLLTSLLDSRPDLIHRRYAELDRRAKALAAYLRRLRSALRRGGRVAIIDFHKRDLPVGPRTEHKLDREECLDHIGSAGMRVRSDIETLHYQHFFVLGD